MSLKIWTTADGDEIYVEDMTDTHINNVLSYLENKKTSLPEIYYDVLREGFNRNLPLCVERVNKFHVDSAFELFKEQKIGDLNREIESPGDYKSSFEYDPGYLGPIQDGHWWKED